MFLWFWIGFLTHSYEASYSEFCLFGARCVTTNLSFSKGGLNWSKALHLSTLQSSSLHKRWFHISDKDLNWWEKCTKMRLSCHLHHLITTKKSMQDVIHFMTDFHGEMIFYETWQNSIFSNHFEFQVSPHWQGICLLVKFGKQSFKVEQKIITSHNNSIETPFLDVSCPSDSPDCNSEWEGWCERVSPGGGASHPG